MSAPRVLLVEDNRLLRWWMASSLESGGFAVLAPESSDEALKMAGTWPVDLLVTDWRLGDGPDGFEVLAHARLFSPGLFAVLISAEADEGLAEHARAAGFNVVIRKPFPVAEIVAAARTASGSAGREEPELHKVEVA